MRFGKFSEYTIYMETIEKVMKFVCQFLASANKVEGTVDNNS